MKFSIGVAILALSTIGTAQSPTFTRKDIGRAFMCGKVFGRLAMGVKNEAVALQLKSNYILAGCMELQDIAEDSKDAELVVKK